MQTQLSRLVGGCGSEFLAMIGDVECLFVKGLAYVRSSIPSVVFEWFPGIPGIEDQGSRIEDRQLRIED